MRHHMMGDGWTMRWLCIAAMLSLALFASCAPGMRPTDAVVPAACQDSTYVQLLQQNPDSLPVGAYAQLRALDRNCANARAQSRRGTSWMMGAGHDSGRWMGMGVMMLVMVAMMLAMA